jgi:hypothetical protein
MGRKLAKPPQRQIGPELKRMQEKFREHGEDGERRETVPSPIFSL